ncbi:MAG: heavy metal translocating P-type ATPase [Rhodobacteraceae bacterium]|nr:heavy metal translocating P-type ATPase [Paracoccaceae bacterium]
MPDTARHPPRTVTLPIEGMHCASCVGRVERALRAVPGVTAASVNLATERAEIVLSAPVAPEALSGAVAAAGFAVPAARTELAIEGMHCASCVGRVEAALKAVPGVAEASVNLATERASVTGSAGVEALVAAVRAAGYAARPLGARAGQQAEAPARRLEAAAAELGRGAALAGALTLPVFVLEMGAHLSPAMHQLVMSTIGMQASWLIQAALTTLVLLGPGRRFLAAGLPALFRGAPDMNSLVAVGTTAAWGYSLVATFAPGLLPEGSRAVYFEAAAVIVTLVLAGRWLEARARGRASAAIRALVALAPPVARLRRAEGIAEIPAAEVRPGDILEVRPGERLAADGVVVEGESWVDESMITGEPVPVRKAAGARVTGGTVNGTGAFAFRATAVGADTVLARIVRMVEEAQGAKLPIQALVDRVTLWFVPAVMGVAGLTFLLWLAFGPEPALAHALVSAVAVLIIACPCAMGLATPVSILVGTGRGAELGLLFRRGDALQRLAGVRVVAFDKTGTLTEGRPRLTDLVPAPGFDREAVLARAAAVEARSEHPLARALVAAASEAGLALPAAAGFRSRTGLGVTAEVAGETVAVGSERFLRGLGIDPAPLAPAAARLAEAGRTVILVAIGGRPAAAAGIADPPRPGAAEAVRALQRMGLEVAMVTGDARATALSVARGLGIGEVAAEVPPEGKAAAVRRLRAAHGPVAFAGDGINDAPALAEADVGIAMGGGTDIAIEAAEVVLMSGAPGGVAGAVALSRATLANIRQNLFWAFAYNVALIPVAAGLLWPAFGLRLSPALAAGAMALSSLFVVGNALRLRRFVPPRAGRAAP